MRIQAEWRACSPTLLNEYPEICREGVRRVQVKPIPGSGFADPDFKLHGHQHLVIKSKLGGFIWGDSNWGLVGEE